MDILRLDFDLPADPSTAFPYLVDDRLLTTWWPTEAETDPVPGGRYRLHWPGPEWTLTGTYEVVDPPGRLVYTWSWDHDDLPPRRVEFDLVANGAGTVLSIAHASGSDEETGGYREGWEHFMGRLAEVLSDSA